MKGQQQYRCRLLHEHSAANRQIAKKTYCHLRVFLIFKDPPSPFPGPHNRCQIQLVGTGSRGAQELVTKPQSRLKRCAARKSSSLLVT